MENGKKGLKGLEAQDLANRIYEIGMLVNQSGDLDDVIRAIVKRLLEELDCDYVGIALVDDKQERIHHRWGLMRDGTWLSGAHSQPVGQGVTGTVAETGEPLCLDDVSTFPTYFELIRGIKSEMAVPLKVGPTVIGTVDVESTELAWFGETEQSVLQALATPVAQALQNAKLFEKERRRLEQLTVLNKVSRIITSTTDVDELTERTVDTIRDQLGYPFVGMGLYDDESGRVVLRAISSVVEVDLEIGHSQAMGEGVAGEVFRTGKSLLIPDVRQWPNYLETGEAIKSEMCCPIKVGDKVIGILDVESTEAHAFHAADLLVLQTVSEHISQAIENARNLERTNRMREDLSKMVIHDLRNPLTVIQTSLEYMEKAERSATEDPPPDGERMSRPGTGIRYIAKAKASCEQITMMINSLLEIHKIEEGELRITREPTQIADLVEQISSGMSIVAGAMNVDLVFRVEENLPVTILDRSIITRVIENVLANALKFTPEGGTITMSVEPAPAGVLEEMSLEEGAGILFKIEDNGPGIPHAEQERIFEKFAKGSTNGETSRGAGLGLAFCRQAVLAHGGTIWVQSMPGKGSTFSFVLPLEPPPR